MKGICQCCGQPLPPDEPEGLRLRGKRRQIFDLVRKAGKQGIRADRIFSALYDDDPNGGPDTGLKIIAVHVFHANRALEKFGLRIHGGRTGHGALGEYRLIDVARPAA